MEADQLPRESAGFISWLGDSLRAHVDERIKSPFAGAFLIAWIAVNWQAILILCFSETTIEQRIKVVLAEHSGFGVVVIKPILYALGIAASFYILSALFLFVAELYSLARSWVERLFDKAKWRSPDEYLAAKKKYLDEISELKELAADNLSKVSLAEEKANDASLELIRAKKEVTEIQAILTSQIEEKEGLLSRLSEADQERTAAITQYSRLVGVHSTLRAASEQTIQQLREVREAVLQARLDAHPSAWNQFVRFERALENLREQIVTAGQIQ